MPRNLSDYLNGQFGIGDEPRATTGPVESAPASPAPTAPPSTTPGQGTGTESFGNPTYDSIAAFYRQRGHTPTLQDVSAWGTNVDQNYMDKIRQHIYTNFQPPASTTTPAAFDVNAFGKAWLASGGKTTQDFQNFYNQYPGASTSGWKIGGSHGGNLEGPNGHAFDAVISSGTGGTGAWWNPRNGGPTGAGTEFDDPWGSTLESFVTDRINSLMTPENRQGLNAYISELLGNASRSKQRAGQFATSLRGRQEELRQYPYTAGDEAIMRAKTFDALERRRQQTLKNNLEQQYAKGFAPTSGTTAQVALDTNQQFEQQRTGLESNLLQSAIGESQRRKDEATQLESIIQQALSGGDLMALQDMASRASAETEALTRADARQREILATIGLPLELMNSRQANANATLSGTSPAQGLSTILSLFGLGNQTNQINAQNNANNLQGLGQLLAVLFPKPSGSNQLNV